MPEDFSKYLDENGEIDIDLLPERGLKIRDKKTGKTFRVVPKEGQSVNRPIQEQHPLIPRFKLQNVANPQSTLRYLAGQGMRAAYNEKGQLAVKMPEDDHWSVMDPAGLDVGDLTDWFGDAFIMASDVAGAIGVGIGGAALGAPAGPVGVAGGAYVGQAAGGAAAAAGAETMRQGLGKLVGIDPTLGEIAQGAGREAAISGAAGLVAPGIGKIASLGVKGAKAVARPMIGKLSRAAAEKIPAEALEEVAEKRIGAALEDGPAELLYSRQGDKGVRLMVARSSPEVPAPTPEDIAARYADVPTRPEVRRIPKPEGEGVLVPSYMAPPATPPKILHPDDFAELPPARTPPPQYAQSQFEILQKPGMDQAALDAGAGRYLTRDGKKTWVPYTRAELQAMPRAQIEDAIGRTHKGYLGAQKGGRPLKGHQIRVIDDEVMQGTAWKTLNRPGIVAIGPVDGRLANPRTPTMRQVAGAGVHSFGETLERAASAPSLSLMGAAYMAGSGHPIAAAGLALRTMIAKGRAGASGRLFQKWGMRLMRDTSGATVRRLAASPNVPPTLRMEAQRVLEVLSQEGVTKYRLAVNALLRNPEFRRWLAEEDVRSSEAG